MRDPSAPASAHYARGIQNNDINPVNLMWDPFRKVGALNDFNLINISGDDSEGQQRTGTIARHYVESLIWVLIWVCLYHRKPEDTTESMTAKVVEFQIWRLKVLGKTGDTIQIFKLDRSS